MSLFDLVRSFTGGQGAGIREQAAMGEVARTYVETGRAPDESWAALEGPNGEVHVLAAVRGEPGEWPDPDHIGGVQTEIQAHGGEVVEISDNGLLLARIPKSRLTDLARDDQIRRLEVTRGRTK